MSGDGHERDPKFSRRESEVMGVLFERGEATGRQVWSALGESRTYSTIRKLLSILEEKGHVTHREEGGAFVYAPTIEREAAASSAFDRLIDTFFQGSVSGAVSSLLGQRGQKLSQGDWERISKLIEDAKRR